MQHLFLLYVGAMCVHVQAQPDTRTPRFPAGCVLPAPDSVDITGDGIADLLVHGVHGVATCDIPVSIGSCAVHVTTLPGTELLATALPMGGHDVQGFESGDHVPALASVDQDDHRGHGPAFREGSVRALHWTYGRSGGSKPALTPIAHRTFIFATTMGDRTVYGTFTLKRDGDRASVRIVRGSTLVADALFKVP